MRGVARWLIYVFGCFFLFFDSWQADQVERLITQLGFDKEKIFTISSTGMDQMVDLVCSLGPDKCTLEIALSYYYGTPSSLSSFSPLNLPSSSPSIIFAY